MMRFNGYDRRLERALEATLMVMEALPRRPLLAPPTSPSGASTATMMAAALSDEDAEIADLLEYSVCGHSGDTACELFVDFPSNHRAAPATDGGAAGGVAGAFGFNRRARGGPGTRSGALTEKDRMKVLESMIAHSSYCDAGDRWGSSSSSSSLDVGCSRC